MSVALQYETYLGKIHAEYALKEPRSYCEGTYRGWQWSCPCPASL